jgi:mannose-6-phosphate isomerase-like protein (cupin superfamily)
MKSGGWAAVAMAMVGLGCKGPSSSADTPLNAPLTPAQIASLPSTRVDARFVDHALHVDAQLCDTFYVATARGSTTALGETLAEGDVLEVSCPDPFDVQTTELALVATVSHPCVVKARPGTRKRVVRKSDNPELSWANGTMHAQLDFDNPTAEVHFGRLDGTAAVAEHTHPSSWEILCAVEAAGTFTLAGKPQRLGPRSVVVVPPATKHAWQPDPGTRLVAFQIYDPPGPEQRFKALAAPSDAPK